MIYYKSWQSECGMLTLAEEENEIREIRFGSSREPSWTERETEAIAWAARELAQYFRGERKVFTFPYRLKGTAFQERVWKVLEAIPYGETRSYGEVAALAGNPKACRAVGMANHANPIPIVVPCHRVIGADGRLTGYGGGIAVKKYLLALEGVRWKE